VTDQTDKIALAIARLHVDGTGEQDLLARLATDFPGIDQAEMSKAFARAFQKMREWSDARELQVSRMAEARKLGAETARRMLANK
jgi:hypothetical protein